MWYVEATIHFEKNIKERWEGLTKEQARDIHEMYFDDGVGVIQSGKMEK